MSLDYAGKLLGDDTAAQSNNGKGQFPASLAGDEHGALAAGLLADDEELEDDVDEGSESDAERDPQDAMEEDPAEVRSGLEVCCMSSVVVLCNV